MAVRPTDVLRVLRRAEPWLFALGGIGVGAAVAADVLATVASLWYGCV